MDFELNVVPRDLDPNRGYILHLFHFQRDWIHFFRIKVRGHCWHSGWAITAALHFARSIPNKFLYVLVQGLDVCVCEFKCL